MVEQKQAVAEIVRPELAERGLSDPLEFLYKHIAEVSDAERINLFSYALEAEGQAFEVQCRICAEYAKGSRLKEFIGRYNKQATKAGGKVIAYTYAKKMSRVGMQMLESGKRMTQDYPALSPTYFVTALDAPGFTVALDRAQGMVAAHQEDPEQAPKYTVKAFKEEVSSEKLIGKDLQKSFSAGTPLKVLAPDPVPVTANCYDCEHCWQPNGHQRLAVVNTRGTLAIDLLLEPCSAWVCRKTKQVISVRTQAVARAEAIAKSCDSLSLQSVPTEPIDAAPEDTQDTDESAVDEVVISLHDEHLDPAGVPLSPEEVDAYLMEDS